MKFGFRTGSMGADVADAMRRIKACGYDAVEICLEPAPLRPGTLTQEAAERIRKTADALALTVASVSFHADREEMDARVRQTLAAVDAAAWLGAGVLIVNAERAVEDPAAREEQFARVVDRMAHLCALAEKGGIRIAVEPEPLLVIAGVDDMLRLVEAVGSPALAVNLDIGHAEVTEGDVPAAVEQLGELIVHTHIEDIADRVHKHLVPGEGHIDFRAVFDAFARVEYDGVHTIDLFSLGADADRTAAAALNALKRILAGEGEMR